jgi:CIC family chloride channel protein
METPVAKYIETTVLRFDIDTLKSVAFAEMSKRNTTEGYLVEKNGKLAGKISILNLVMQSESKYCIEIADRSPLSLKKDASLQQAIEAASQFVGEAIPVVDLDGQTLIGTITEGAILNAYLTIQKQIIDLEKK